MCKDKTIVWKEYRLRIAFPITHPLGICTSTSVAKSAKRLSTYLPIQFAHKYTLFV